MLLEASSGSPAPVEARRWHAPERAPLPEEPGRLASNALINVARRARGCRTRGDDRIETRAYAVKRLLWRWGHAQRSGRFACSIAQLVAGLAPILGWGPPPTTRAGRERWVRAHRKSVQRWLDDLQAAGLLSYEGERDNRGQLWRTIITLRAAPSPPADELRWARERMRAWRRRSRRRQRRRRPPRRCLELIRRRSQRPQQASRTRLARRRACQIHEHRQAAGNAHAMRADQKKDLTHPFGVPASQEHCHQLQGQRLTLLDDDELAPPTFADQEGAQARDAGDHSAPRAPAEGSGNAVNDELRSENEGRDVADLRSASPGDASADQELCSAVLFRRVAAREAAIRAGAEPPTKHHILQATRRASYEALRGWPAGRPAPDRVLAEAFEHATGQPARTWRDARHREPLTRAMARYERHVEYRPSQWPVSAAGALALAMAACADDPRSVDEHGYSRGPLSLTWAIGRLDVISKQMAAAAGRADAAGELERRRRRRARRDRREQRAKVAFRGAPARAAAFTSSEHQRRAAIERLLRGEEPDTAPLLGFLTRARNLLDAAGDAPLEES
jgi:hypothetical protein